MVTPHIFVQVIQPYTLTLPLEVESSAAFIPYHHIMGSDTILQSYGSETQTPSVSFRISLMLTSTKPYRIVDRKSVCDDHMLKGIFGG